MKLELLIILFLGFVGAGCEKDSPAPKLVMPSDLEVNVIKQDPGSGNITLSLSSNNTNYYLIDFGDGANSEPIKTTEESVTHSYRTSGTYNIKVQAHATASAFITSTHEVAINLPGSGNGIPATGYSTPEAYEGMNLVWRDEFDASALNTNDWTFEIGTGSNGWGNNELEYYRQENTELKDGYLIITAKKENFGGQAYTSSRIKTQGKKSFKYGRVDIRAVLPQGQGIWPALWMLGESISTVGWPASGEIDIMELIGGGAGRDNTVHGTLHWSNNGQHASTGKGVTLDNGIFADEFHVFSIVWNENSITWFLDDEQFYTVDITPAELSEFHQNFFLIFNVAVGGNWPGSPDASTTFPQRMIVDYVRVFQPE